jgi:hypothetical protein
MRTRLAVGWVATGLLVTTFAVVNLAEHRATAGGNPATGVPTQPGTDEIPRSPLITGLSFRVDSNTGQRESTYSVPVTNTTDASVSIASVGRSGPGLRLLAGTAEPTVLPPRGDGRLSVTFKVEDCAAITRKAWPLPVTLRLGDRTVTQYLELDGTSPQTQWQVATAQAVCEPARASL